MSTTAMTLGLRPRPRFGPALRRFRLPVLPLAVSTGAHVVLVAAVIAGATLWRSPSTKPYIVNLVPAVAAVGTPQGRPAPDPPPRVAPAPPRPPEPPAPKEPPAAKELPPPKELPVAKALPPVKEPPRPAPALPDRQPSPPSATLPERSLPTRAPALPRPGDKELPNVASASTPKSPPAPTPAASAPAAPAPADAVSPAAPPPAAPPLGSLSGSAQGAGAVTLNVSDFPYAWYLRQIVAKIQERWEGKGLPGRQPEIVFEVARDGQVRRFSVGKSSGNPAYDQVALRAVADSNPFPPLPQGYEKPTLTVGLQFIYDPNAR